MYNEIFYNAIAKCNSEIRALSNNKDFNHNKDLLFSLIDRMLMLNSIAQHDGLFMIEDTINLFDDSSTANRLIKKYGHYIFDFFDDDAVMAIGLSSFMANGLHDFDALQYLIILYSYANLLKGDGLVVFRAKILSLLSDELLEECEDYLEKKKELANFM